MTREQIEQLRRATNFETGLVLREARLVEAELALIGVASLEPLPALSPGPRGIVRYSAEIIPFPSHRIWRLFP